MNTFGRNFRLTTFGESHGIAMGGVIDGCPSGITLDCDLITEMLERRRGGRGGATTTRREADQPRFISGLMDGVTTGTPLAFIIENENQRPDDYTDLKEVYRPSHADFTYEARYGLPRDYRGGGRASGRETVVRVVAGAIAMQILHEKGIDISSKTLQMGPWPADIPDLDKKIAEVVASGDSVGAVALTVIEGLSAGVGNPIFDKLDAQLAYALMGIGAVKGVEIGGGFALASMYGSEANDPFYYEEGRVRTRSNNSGGIQGGISNGEAIVIRTAFKPIASIGKPQETIRRDGTPITLTLGGRHDACVLPRALPVLDAMVALVLVDNLLRPCI